MIFRRQNEQGEVRRRRVAGVLQASLLTDRHNRIKEHPFISFVRKTLESLWIEEEKGASEAPLFQPQDTTTKMEENVEGVKREEIAFCTKMKRKLLNKLF